MKYDYLIVGAGLFGSVFARLATDIGKKCLVIDKRNHICGNCYSQKIDKIDVHQYGPHIFHTSSEKIWNFIQQFGDFTNLELNVLAHYDNKLYSLPFNMWTFYQMWGVSQPEDAIAIINSQKFIGTPTNLEEYALSIVGEDIYHKLIYGYTKKQWRTNPKKLPISILKRIPFRLTFNNNYFNDKFQGIPTHGYYEIFKNLLDGIQVELDINYISKQAYFEKISKNIVYTGHLDELCKFTYGKLNYRSLRFEHEELSQNSFQHTPIINYTDETIPYTRITEHKHFINQHPNTYNTIITKEYPIDYIDNAEPMYPINDEQNNNLHQQYLKAMSNNNKYILGGRLAEYKYYDMHQVIGSAMNTFKKTLS